MCSKGVFIGCNGLRRVAEQNSRTDRRTTKTDRKKIAKPAGQIKAVNLNKRIKKYEKQKTTRIYTRWRIYK